MVRYGQHRLCTIRYVRDDLTNTILDPQATQEGLVRCARGCVDGHNSYHGPLFVRQVFPDARAFDAVLRFDHHHAPTIAEILSGSAERVRLLVHSGHEPFLRIHTDCQYHPYQDYFRCIDLLAQHVADVSFMLCMSHEDDAGDCSYLVDRYDIADGRLRWQRRQTPDEDLDGFLERLG